MVYQSLSSFQQSAHFKAPFHLHRGPSFSGPAFSGLAFSGPYMVRFSRRGAIQIYVYLYLYLLHLVV